MSALSIRNMNWTVGQMEQIRDSASYRKQSVMAVCEKIAAAMTPDQYVAWLNTTSDNNDTFTAQAYAMLEQIDEAHLLVNRVTLNWQAAWLVLDMCEGTERNPIISGGEVLELGTITNNIEIPF